jgi:thiamine kinase-like enzyme
MWSQILNWHEQAQRTVPTIEARWGAEAAARFASTLTEHLGASWERSTAELALLQAAIPKDSVAVFCHNDALAGNILRNPESGEVHLIDFE